MFPLLCPLLPRRDQTTSQAFARSRVLASPRMPVGRGEEGDFVSDNYKLVVTPLRGDRNPSRQQLLERPEMIGQPQNHRRRPPLVAIHAFPTRQPQSPMGSLEVVIEELQAYQRIPGSIPFGEGVRLAGKGIEPIPQGAVESFDMHRPGWLQRRPQRGADLD